MSDPKRVAGVLKTRSNGRGRRWQLGHTMFRLDGSTNSAQVHRSCFSVPLLSE
jgi:hypothetical protein